MAEHVALREARDGTGKSGEDDRRQRVLGRPKAGRAGRSMSGRITWRDGDRILFRCPKCGQAARADLNGDRVDVLCFAGCPPENTLAGVGRGLLLAELQSDIENRPQGNDGAGSMARAAPLSSSSVSGSTGLCRAVYRSAR